MTTRKYESEKTEKPTVEDFEKEAAKTEPALLTVTDPALPVFKKSDEKPRRTLVLLWQAPKTGASFSLYGAYESKADAERVVAEVRGSPAGVYTQAHKDSDYFTEEREVFAVP